jgi:hypothetical protein
LANKFENYVDSILNEVELNNQNYNDLKSEILTYLNEKKEFYEGKGLDSDSAADASIEDFGESKEVGKDLLKTYLPYRKIALISVIISSFVLSTSVFLYSSFFANSVPLIWLFLMLSSAGVTSYFYFNPLKTAKYRAFFIGFMVVFSLISLIGQFYLEAIKHDIIYMMLLVLLIITFVAKLTNIVIGAIHQPISSRFQILNTVQRRINVLFNLVSGIVVLGYTSLISAGFFIFGVPPSFAPITFVLFILGIWVISLVFSLIKVNLSMVGRLLQVGVVALVVSTFFSQKIIDVINNLF